jgi:hypothetical protein
VLFVHPYTLCCGSEGTKGSVNKSFSHIQRHSNKLLWAAKQLNFDIVYMSVGIDSGGINARHFPIEPSASLHSGSESYAPVKAEIVTDQIALIGGYHGGCVATAAREIIETYFKENTKPLHIYYPLKAIVRVNGDELHSIETIAEHLKGWWENDLLEFPCSLFSAITDCGFQRKSSLFVHTPTHTQKYGREGVEIHFYLGD